MFISQRMTAVFIALAIVALPGLAQIYPPDVQDAYEAVSKHINGLPNGKGGDIKPQTAGAVRESLPGYNMIVVRYRIFPVARIMPEGFKASNLFAVDNDKKIEH